MNKQTKSRDRRLGELWLREDLKSGLVYVWITHKGILSVSTKLPVVSRWGLSELFEEVVFALLRGDEWQDSRWGLAREKERPLPSRCAGKSRTSGRRPRLWSSTHTRSIKTHRAKSQSRLASSTTTPPRSQLLNFFFLFFFKIERGSPCCRLPR